MRKTAGLLALAIVALVPALWAILMLRAFSQANSAIVVSAATPFGDSLYLYQDGDFRPLTAPAADVASLALSPDNQKIAFVFRHRFAEGSANIALLDLSDMQIEVVAPDIPDPLHVLTNYSSLAWSPDGREILFTAGYRNDHEEAGLYLIDVATHTVRATPIQYEEEACGRGIPCLQVDVSWAPGPTPLLGVCRLRGSGVYCEMQRLDPDTWATSPIPANGRRPQWVPGRLEISYECSMLNLAGRTCIYSLEERSSRLLRSGASYGTWSPQGGYVAYVDTYGPAELSRVTIFQPSTGLSLNLYRNDARRPGLHGPLLWISQ